MPQADSSSTTLKPLLPLVLPKATRRLVARAIKQHMAATEALIAFLDQADGDPEEEPCVTDFPHDEDTDREPGLAHTNNLDQSISERDLTSGLPDYWGCDLEEQCEDEGAEHDGREPEDLL